MACSYTIQVPEVGEVEVLESSRCRRISLRIKADRVVHVSAPKQTQPKAIHQFVVENREWIDRALSKVAKKSPIIIFSPTTDFCTKWHRFVMCPDSTDGRIRAQVTPRQGDEFGQIKLSYPEGYDTSQEQLQRLAHRAIDHALKAEAQRYLPQLARQLSDTHGFTYSVVELRNTFAQWGSCNTGGRICLSIQLMRLPDELIRYVILHELCHTVEMNHGPRFRALMQRVTGGRLSELEKKMKQVHTRY